MGFWPGLARVVVFVAIAVFAAGAAAAPAAPGAEKRVALVIGIEDYPQIGRLANPVRDAYALEAALKGLGFKVAVETDRSKRRLAAALDAFVEDYQGADLALVFFAGHGVQIGGRNFLLATDSTAGSAAELEASSLSLDDIFSRLAKVAPRRIVLLDACRNDPTQAVIADPDHPIAPGLARIGYADGTLYAFATAPGVTASDGSGEHSPFTAAMLAHFGKSGLELRSILTLVRMEVYERSRGQQLPYVEDALPGAVFFDAKAEPLSERDRLLMAMAGIDGDTRAQVERVAAEYEMPLAPLFGALVAAQLSLGQADFPTRDKVLKQAAEEFIKLRSDLKTLASSDPAVTRLRAQAERDLLNGNMEAARAALTQAIELDRASGEQLEARLRERNLSQAASRSIRAGIARARLEYRDAAADFAAAAALTELWDRALSWKYRKSQADVLQLQGEEFGETAALIEAMDANRYALALAPRLDRADDWALTQHQYGNILEVLAARENSAPRFEQALDAYRLAMEVRTREHAPALWASTQNNLGIALWMLGLIENSTARLESALEAFQLALNERTRERAPLEWAQTQSNLGVVLRALGERESGTARLQQAAAAYRLALQERTRARVPLEWAQTQNNLGNALVALGEREEGTLPFAEAVRAFRGALQERTRARVPLDWAATQYNLGVALASLAEREASAPRFREAVAAYRLAMQERTRERVPADWAAIQINLGDALRWIGELEDGAVRLDESIAVYRAALAVLAREQAPHRWGEAQNGLGVALRALGERQSGTAELEQAAAAFREALRVRSREREPREWADSTLHCAIAETIIAIRSAAGERKQRLAMARRLATDALAVYQTAGTKRDVAAAQKALADIDAAIARAPI